MRACTSFVWSNPNTPGKVKLTDAAAGLRTYVRAGFGGRDQNTYRTGSQCKNMEPAVVVFFGWSPSCRPAGQNSVRLNLLTWLISHGTIFFSHNKLVNDTF